MFAELIAALRKAGSEPTDDVIAEAFWMLQFLPNPSANVGHDTDWDQNAAGTGAVPSPADQIRRPPKSSEPSETPGDRSNGETEIYSQSGDMDGATAELGGIGIQSPGAPALADAIDLARALRPLGRRVPSRNSVVIDEEETARRMVEEHIFVPVLRPDRTRWLTLHLVFDQSPSMAIWHKATEELYHLFLRLGTFRNIRFWSLHADQAEAEPGIAHLTRSERKGQTRLHPKALVDPSGRSLVFVVSDCVAPGWRSGAVSRALDIWGHNGLVAILQMLPERLWHRSSLGRELEVDLRCVAAGTPNLQLKTDTSTVLMLGRRGKLRGITVPVIALDPAAFRNWALMITGMPEVRVPGYLFSTVSRTITQPGTRTSGDSEGRSLGARRVERFLEHTSPLGVELAKLLAAAPVISLPIIRLIQSAMLPKSRQSHVAEVFLGGLLRPIIPSDDPEVVLYDFVDDARAHLLKLANQTSTEQVYLQIYNKISDYIASHIQPDHRFQAIVVSPDDTIGQLPIAAQRAFASATAAVLHDLGYRELANTLREAATASGHRRATPLAEEGEGAEFADRLDQEEQPISVDQETYSRVDLPSKNFSSRDYLDLEIRIEAQANEDYRVSVHGPFGTAHGTLVLPTASPEYQRALAQLAALDTNEDSLIQLGQLLFEALFTSRVKEIYVGSQGILTHNQDLRLVFDIDGREAALAAVPWEFLADPDQGPLAMLNTSMVRYLPTQTIMPRLAAPLPLKVLLTGAETHPNVQVDRELREIQRALERHGQQVAITVEPHLTRTILAKRLREGFHVWHFVGHGGGGSDGTTGVLQLEDTSGASERISARELSILLNRSGVRLVILNACQSAALRVGPLQSIALALVRADVPAVITMQFTVPEEATRAFTSNFYQALAEGFPIDACVAEGRKAVMSVTGLGRPDWGIPVVYTRAPNGQLFSPPAQTVSVLPDNRHPVGEGLLALRSLMDMPSAHVAIAAARESFEDVSRQINLLAHYKRLHDQLQQIEDSARIVDGARRRLPQDLRAWDDLARNEQDLYARIDAVLKMDSDTPNAFWAKRLERAQQEIRAGIEQANLDLLSSAMNRIDQVVNTVPWSLNVRLVELAASLPLRALTQNLSMVAARLDTLVLDERLARQRADLVQGIAALEALDVRLSQLVQQHNLFQELDNELRQVEIGLDPDGRNLALIWSDLQPLHMKVCADESAIWTPKLIAIAIELEQSLATSTGGRTSMIFWRYRSQVNQSFNRVDADLLELCQELQRISGSFEFVLRMVQ